MSGSGARGGDEFVQDFGQAVQLYQVGGGELIQDLLAPGGQPDPDEPPVAGIGAAPHETGYLSPIDQFDRAVMPQQQVIREIPHGRRLVAGMTLDRYEQLMLDMGQPGFASLIFTPALEPAQAAAERQQVLEVSAVLGLLRHALSPQLVSSA
jgi:hypothetical protein